MAFGTLPPFLLCLVFLSLFATVPPVAAAGSADEFFDDTFGDFREELEAARDNEVMAAAYTELKLTAAEAQTAAAQARVARAELDLERSVLRAPFDGVVTAVTAWPGMFVLTLLQEEPLVELADASRMVARARVVASRMDDFAPGQPARVRIEGAWRPARVYRLGVKSEDVIERGVTYALDVIFEVTAEDRLRPGQPATVMLEE